MMNIRRRTMMSLVLIAGLFGVAAPASAQDIPWDPKENITTVEIWDELVGGHSVLHVTYWTEEASDYEVWGWMEDNEENEYDATHPDGKNEFHVEHYFDWDRTGETILLAAYASFAVIGTDRAPNGGYYEYTFGTGPQTYEDGDDGSLFPEGVEVWPLTGFWGGVPSVYWTNSITFSYQGDATVDWVRITIEVEGSIEVNNQPMADGGGNYYQYLWTPYPSHGQTTVTYNVHHTDGSTETIDFPLLIDPSGIVFNSATADPIPGATVTLFYSDTGDTGSFVEVDETSPPPVIDPEENPQTTDSIGHYGWDVQEGYYYVHVAKAGFSPKDSPVVYVPPEVTTLNVWLDPIAGPAPRLLKEQAMAAIAGYDKAVEHIQKSLADELWEDESHLDPKHGKKVFDEEKKAVKTLMGVIKKKDTPPDVAEVCNDVISMLVEADEQLAHAAFEDASAALEGISDPKVAKKVEKVLEKCDKEFEKAEEDLDKENYDKAIDHYRKAWKHAQKALKEL